MNQLEEERKKRGLSQNDLINYLGVGRTTIYRWEAGLCKLKTHDQERIEELFHRIDEGETIDSILAQEKKELLEGIDKKTEFCKVKDQ